MFLLEPKRCAPACKEGVPNSLVNDPRRLGDLRYQVDFRDVYAGLLRDWLSVDPATVLAPHDVALKLFH